MNIPTLEDIRAAHARIKRAIHFTPVFTSETLNRMSGATLFFKCENFQRMGAFKIRGASNAIFSLTDAEAKNGVATHSSGNHAQAVALAARLRGVPAYIVMPNNAAQVKQDAVAGYGGKITLCEPTQTAREKTLQEVIAKTGAVAIHPYDDYRVIAGQGTVSLEFLEQINCHPERPLCHPERPHCHPERSEGSYLDYLIAPIGGGGLISGNSIATSALSPQTKIIGAEPEGADDAYQSFLQNKFVPSNNNGSICDGLLMPVGKLTFPIIQKHVHKIFTVSDSETLSALRLIWERMKIIIEPSSAVTLAIILKNKPFFAGKKVGLILSGGNVDIKKIAAMF